MPQNPIAEKGSLIDPDNIIPIAPTTLNKIKPRKELSEKQKANLEKLISLSKERAKERAMKARGVVEDVENMPRDKILFEVKAKREYVKKTDEEKLEELRQKVMNKKLQQEAKAKRLGKGTIEPVINMPVIHEEKKEEKRDDNATKQMMDMIKMMFEQQQKAMTAQPIVINNAVKKPRKKRATSMKKKFVSDTEDTDDSDFYTDDTTETETDTDFEVSKKANYKLKKLNEIEQRLNMYRQPPPVPQAPPRNNMYSVFK